MSGDAQIWTLVRAPHVYLDQSALRIFCDVTPARRAFHGSNFVQVVVAYFNGVRVLFRAVYDLPVATITIACCCRIARIRYSSVIHAAFNFLLLPESNLPISSELLLMLVAGLYSILF